MSFFSIKDFTTAVQAKMFSFLINTDQNIPAKIIVDSTGAEVLGTKTDAANNATNATALTFMQVFKQISLSIQAAAASLLTLVTAFGNALTRGSGAFDANTQRMVIATDSPGVISTGTAGSPAATVVTFQGITAGTPAAVLPALTAAANGLTKSRVNAGATTNATLLKASAGNIASIAVFNVAAYSVFLKFYNKASAPTVGTDIPTWTIPIAPGGGFVDHFPAGDSYATGIAYAITKLQADADATAVVAGDLTGQIRWI